MTYAVNYRNEQGQITNGNHLQARVVTLTNELAEVEKVTRSCFRALPDTSYRKAEFVAVIRVEHQGVAAILS